MRKLFILFTFLSVSLLGFAYNENVKFPDAGTYAQQFYWTSIGGVTAPMGVNSVESKSGFDCIYINVGQADFDPATGIVGCELAGYEGAGVWVKISSLNSADNEIYFKNSGGTILRGLVIHNMAEGAAEPSSGSDPTPKTSECEGSRGHFGNPTAKHVNFQIEYADNKATISLRSLTGYDLDFAEVQIKDLGGYAMTSDGLGGYTYVFNNPTVNAEWYVRFLYSDTNMGGNEMTSENLSDTDPNIIYYKVGDCAAGGAQNPHLTLTSPTKSSVLLPKGESITVAYTSENDAAATISSEDAYVSISGNVVTAASTGTATITVSQAEVENTWQAASVLFEVNAFDWSDISFLSSSDYKMKGSSSSVNIVNVQTRNAHKCIYITLPDAVGLDCSLTGNFETEGAGMFIYTDAFTVRQTPFTVTCHGVTYDCYVFYNLDETAPVISNVAVTYSNHERAEFTITADETFVLAEVFNNNASMGTFTPTESTINVTGLTATTTYDKLTVKVKDAANNWSDAADVPEFTTANTPSITPVTYNDYGTNKGVYALYSITRDYDQSLVFSAKVDAAFGFNKRVHYYKGGVADVWADLVYNNTTGTYDYTAAAGSFVDGEEWVVEFYFPYTGDAASIVCNYTVGSEQAVPASIPVGAVVLSKAATTLSVGETDNLTATVYPSFATSAGSVTWNSNASYASVDAGTVTAVAAGSADITATCGGVTSEPCVVTVIASLAEAKFYGTGVFSDNSAEKKAFAYEFCFTRSTDHHVTLEMVFSEDVSGVIANDADFGFYINNVGYHLTYNASTKTATYDFDAQSENAEITYRFRFVMPGGLHETANTTYIVGSSNEKVYACVADEDIDNSAVLAAYDGRTAQVIVDRSFSAGSLYTLVLPFEADADQVAAQLPGALTKLNNTIVKDNGDLRVNFVNATTIEAGVPYLYEPSADVINPVFAGVTISKDLNPSEPDELAKYYGIYAPKTGSALKGIANAYVLGSDLYLYATSGLTNDQPMKALRAYFVLNFPADPSPMPGRRARIVFNSNEEQTATGIEDVQGERQSIKVIRGGQLFIIRDGKTYNAQGQLIK